MAAMTWLGTCPALRDERHFGQRVVRCFAERPASFDAMLRAAVARCPDAEAVVCGEVRWRYRELDAHVDAVASRLTALGIRGGDRVALLMPNCPAFVAALCGIIRLGAIAVLLNIREEAPELAFVLADSGAAALLHAPELAGKVPARAALADLAHVLPVAVDWPADTAPLPLLVGAPVSPSLAEEDVAAILYTSGTTGRPKGAMLTHLGLVHAAMIYEACMGLSTAPGQSERSLVTVPMSHVTGLTAGIAAMLRVGGALIVMPQFKADDFIALAAAERMTHTVMVPAMYNLCLMSPRMATADLSCWRIGGYGGAPMPEVTIARLAECLPRLQLMNAYGSTETTGPVVLMPPAQSAGRASAVGCAVPPCDVRIMDDHGCALPPGETGEVWLRAPNVVKGYWRNPQASEEAFVAGYWCSGDLGRLDSDGFLTLLDRKKDMLNRGGFKIYSVEVENVLAACPGVVEAAVVARPCPVLGERVHAVVVASGGGIDLERLQTHCRGRLADYKIPETLTVLDVALPRNANGKVLKRQLRQALAGGA